MALDAMRPELKIEKSERVVPEELDEFLVQSREKLKSMLKEITRSGNDDDIAHSPNGLVIGIFSTAHLHSDAFHTELRTTRTVVFDQSTGNPEIATVIPSTDKLLTPFVHKVKH